MVAKDGVRPEYLKGIVSITATESGLSMEYYGLKAFHYIKPIKID